MSKKRESLIVAEDFSDLFAVTPSREQNEGKVNQAEETVEGLSIADALKSVTRQMEVSGMRERTISDYNRHVLHFVKVTGAQTLEELTVEHIYEWLASMSVSNQTKLTRLKCLKAFLTRCFHNGWLPVNFWRQVNVRVSTPVKEGAAEQEVMSLLSMLDLTDFVQLRDATAVLVMFQTGLRSNTVAQLRSSHVDLNERVFKIGGGLLKNHDQIFLPFDETLARLLAALMRQNESIRKEKRTRNDFMFITQHGNSVLRTPTNNIIQKRLRNYTKTYGLKNINPHALRRGFAKRLLDRGANVAVISKALGHSDLAVTTRYLHLDKEEVVDSLRKYL